MGYGYPPGPDPSSYDSKHPPKRPPHTKSSPTTSKGKGSSSAKAKDRKALAKAWSKPEDEHLLDLVLQMKHPLKWSIIAQSLSDFSAAHGTPERTGKQCRERVSLKFLFVIFLLLYEDFLLTTNLIHYETPFVLFSTSTI